MFSELARVLQPKTGRLVLLCGNYLAAVKALQQLNHNGDGGGNNNDHDTTTASEDQVITMPLVSVFPVNVGGLLAWVIVAQRGTGQVRVWPDSKDRIRRVAFKRDRVEKCRQKEETSNKRSALQS